MLLADDHEKTLAKLRAILSKEFEVVGTASNGREAVAEVERFNPDVLVIDISMPVLDGLQAASQLRGKACGTKIIFLTVHEDQDYLDAAFAAGAYGYVTKSHLTTDLVPAIREAISGHKYVSKSIQQ